MLSPLHIQSHRRGRLLVQERCVVRLGHFVVARDLGHFLFAHGEALNAPLILIDVVQNSFLLGGAVHQLRLRNLDLRPEGGDLLASASLFLRFGRHRLRRLWVGGGRNRGLGAVFPLFLPRLGALGHFDRFAQVGHFRMILGVLDAHRIQLLLQDLGCLSGRRGARSRNCRAPRSVRSRPKRAHLRRADLHGIEGAFLNDLGLLGAVAGIQIRLQLGVQPGERGRQGSLLLRQFPVVLELVGADGGFELVEALFGLPKLRVEKLRSSFGL